MTYSGSSSVYRVANLSDVNCFQMIGRPVEGRFPLRMTQLVHDKAGQQCQRVWKCVDADLGEPLYGNRLQITM